MRTDSLRLRCARSDPLSASTLRREQRLELQNFLDPSSAQDLHRWLCRDMPAEWWFTAVHDGDGVRYFRGARGRRDAQAVRLARGACDAAARGRFSYCFDRTFQQHCDGCECLQCAFIDFMDGSPVRAYLQSLGLKPGAINEVFCSCYRPGDFLAPHHDESNGGIGFVYQLSSDWKPQHGGHLMFLEPDWVHVDHAIVPTFNTLTLFRIPKGTGAPHMVSQVVAGRRLAITGWYGN